MFQESEIANLILSLVSVLLFVFVFINKDLPKLWFMYIGFFFVLCGNLFTVIEGVFWNNLFNLLEHLCYAISGTFFLAGCWTLSRRPPDQKDRNP